MMMTMMIMMMITMMYEITHRASRSIVGHEFTPGEIFVALNFFRRFLLSREKEEKRGELRVKRGYMGETGRDPRAKISKKMLKNYKNKKLRERPERV